MVATTTAAGRQQYPVADLTDAAAGGLVLAAAAFATSGVPVPVPAMDRVAVMAVDADWRR